eukprot:TRINITY_DN16929_c0_g1_i1.p1 TRINITY_DN16929_c0_g1~~TRINITY_DN16929_c0_g1_i1.p1  ORF type:complete len:777 (-),score=134.41 TRINITY_DN16929_c0_g1_i1:82-2412(-)
MLQTYSISSNTPSSSGDDDKELALRSLFTKIIGGPGGTEGRCSDISTDSRGFHRNSVTSGSFGEFTTEADLREELRRAVSGKAKVERDLVEAAEAGVQLLRRSDVLQRRLRSRTSRTTTDFETWVDDGEVMGKCASTASSWSGTSAFRRRDSIDEIYPERMPPTQRTSGRRSTRSRQSTITRENYEELIMEIQTLDAMYTSVAGERDSLASEVRHLRQTRRESNPEITPSEPKRAPEEQEETYGKLRRRLSGTRQSLSNEQDKMGKVFSFRQSAVLESLQERADDLEYQLNEAASAGLALSIELEEECRQREILDIENHELRSTLEEERASLEQYEDYSAEMADQLHEVRIGQSAGLMGHMLLTKSIDSQVSARPSISETNVFFHQLSRNSRVSMGQHQLSIPGFQPSSWSDVEDEDDSGDGRTGSSKSVESDLRTRSAAPRSTQRPLSRVVSDQAVSELEELAAKGSVQMENAVTESAVLHRTRTELDECRRELTMATFEIGDQRFAAEKLEARCIELESEGNLAPNNMVIERFIRAAQAIACETSQEFAAKGSIRAPAILKELHRHLTVVHRELKHGGSNAEICAMATAVEQFTASAAEAAEADVAKLADLHGETAALLSELAAERQENEISARRLSGLASNDGNNGLHEAKAALLASRSSAEQPSVEADLATPSAPLSSTRRRRKSVDGVTKADTRPKAEADREANVDDSRRRRSSMRLLGEELDAHAREAEARGPAVVVQDGVSVSAGASVWWPMPDGTAAPGAWIQSLIGF